MNKKKLILVFVLLGFIIGIIFGSFEIVKFSGFREKDNERNKIKFDSLSSIEKILLGIYFLSINSFGFTIITFIPVIPVCLLWNLYRKNRNGSDKLWPVMVVYWGLYSEIIYICWGLPFLKKTRYYMSTWEIILNNLNLFLIIAAFSLLLFHISFRIYNALRKGPQYFILINFLFLIFITIFLRFFFAAYFIDYIPQIFRNIKLFLVLLIIFIVLSISCLYIDRSSLKRKSSSISKLGIFALFTLLFFFALASFGYYMENRKTESEIYSASNSNINERGNYVNVILILIDTLRSDHLSCYGYNQKTSPNIDKLAKEGVLFTNSFSQASWTKSSVASLFTSLYPTQHNSNTFDDTLPDKANTIAEILKGEGYTTSAFIANPIIGKTFNYNQGFDLYYDEFTKDKIYYSVLRNSFMGDIIKSISRNKFIPEDMANATTLNKMIIPWLKTYKDTKFFLYIHYKDPHSPYNPPTPFFEKYVDRLNPEVYKGSDKFDINRTEMALYDGEIEFTDYNIGEVLKTVDKLNLTKKTLIILLSDHGEAFLEHENKEHGLTLYQEEISVPLIMRLPDYIPASKTITYQASTIDIMPTILDILNIQYKGIKEGESLFPIIKNQQLKKQRDFIFFEELFAMGKPITLFALRIGEYKYIFTKALKGFKINNSKIEQLFDLKNDPKEFCNIIKKKPEEARLIREKINLLVTNMKKTAIPSAKTKIDEKTKDQIKALGYIQ